MNALVVLAVLVLIAVLAPLVGVDSRWERAGLRPDRPARGRPRRSVPAPGAATRASKALRGVRGSDPAVGSGVSAP